MLNVDTLRLGYGGLPVLDGVSFSLAEGNALALLGRNGAGKSTLMKALIGLIPLESGQIFWRGKDISRWPPFRRARAGIGYVPEERRIFSDLTVAENLATGLRPALPVHEKSFQHREEERPELPLRSVRAAEHARFHEVQEKTLCRILHLPLRHSPVPDERQHRPLIAPIHRLQRRAPRGIAMQRRAGNLRPFSLGKCHLPAPRLSSFPQHPQN